MRDVGNAWRWVTAGAALITAGTAVVTAGQRADLLIAGAAVLTVALVAVPVRARAVGVWALVALAWGVTAGASFEDDRLPVGVGALIVALGATGHRLQAAAPDRNRDQKTKAASAAEMPVTRGRVGSTEEEW